jgi:hypothetical protein
MLRVMPITTHYSHYLATATVDGAVAELAAIISRDGALRAFDERSASAPAGAGKWSRKEILGHLSDSAGNNLQRIVRAQIPAHLTGGVLRGPGYAQDDWIRVQATSARSWAETIDLWLALNRHLLHVIKHVNTGALQQPIVVGDDEPVTLEHIIVDYVAHQLHHLKQITG